MRAAERIASEDQRTEDAAGRWAAGTSCTLGVSGWQLPTCDAAARIACSVSHGCRGRSSRIAVAAGPWEA